MGRCTTLYMQAFYSTCPFCARDTTVTDTVASNDFELPDAKIFWYKKIPTSRKNREKWGTRFCDGFECGYALTALCFPSNPLSTYCRMPPLA
jgi:hypothetical protein